MSAARQGVVVPRAESERTRAALVAAGWLDAGLKPQLIDTDLIALPLTADCSGADQLAAAGIAFASVQALGFEPARKKRESKAPADVLKRMAIKLLEDRPKGLPEPATDTDGAGAAVDPPPPHQPTNLDAAALAALALEIPRKWELHGDLVLLPPTAFASPVWRGVEPALWHCVCDALKVGRVARKAPIDPGLKRESQVVLLVGETGWTEHVDNGVRYSYDVTKCMFSAGNITEKLRVAGFPCAGETVVDLYAGIGYFTLPYLVKAGAAHLHACEWNPHAAAALRKNLALNGVADRCTVYEGDNAKVAPVRVADRVNLGLIPSSEEGWPVACRALKSDKPGMLHVHDNVTVAPQPAPADAYPDADCLVPAAGRKTEAELTAAALTARATEIAATFSSLLRVEHGAEWTVSSVHTEKVKSYAPRIYHVVFDFLCTPPGGTPTAK